MSEEAPVEESPIAGDIEPDQYMENLPPSRRKGKRHRTKMGGNFRGIPGEFHNQCEALSHRSGKRCRNEAIHAGKCKFHGGKVMIGPANGNWKGGKYSKYMPERLLERYEEAENDSELLSARADVAVMQVRVAELLKQLNVGESASFRKNMKKELDSFRRAFNNADPQEMIDAMDRMEGVVEAGAKEDQVWAEITQMIDAKTNVASREWKRLVDMHQVITAERAMVLFGYIGDIILRNVVDENARATIAAEIGKLVAVGPAGDGGTLLANPVDRGGRPGAKVVPIIHAGGVARPLAADSPDVGLAPGRDLRAPGGDLPGADQEPDSDHPSG